MSKNKNYHVKGRALVRTYLLLCLMFVSHSVWADDYMQNASNYTCMQMGMDKLRFTLPTQNDLTINEGVQEGKVYVSLNGGDQELLFDWKCDDYSDLDKGYLIKAYKGGTFQLVGKAKSWKTFTSSDGWVKYYLYDDDNDDDHRTTTIDWVIPYEMRGKNLKLYVWAHVNHSGAGDWHVPSASTRRLMLDWDAPDAAAVGVELSEFMLAYDQRQVGKIMAVYNFNAKTINTAKLYYTDAGTKVKKSIDIDKKTVGYAYLPMNRPYEDVYIEADVIDSDGYPVTVKSEVLPSVSMVHVPLNFSASLTTKGTAMLSWTVEDASQPDMDENDAFEIQRNVNGGDNSSWQSCATEFFEYGKNTYTFEDENYLDSYKGKPVVYRIRRVSTGVWSWSDGSGCATAIQNNTPILPQVVDATVARSTKWDDESHMLNVAFDFKPNGTYDNDGNIVIDGRSYMLINSAVDWLRFKDAVQAASGKKDVYALLNGDITVDQPVGSTSSPFCGVFNGNGHTLNVNFSDSRAPFIAVGKATIKDLTVDGTIRSSARFTAGLIGEVQSQRVTIDRCVVKAEITIQVNGDASSGGLIGLMSKYSEANISNSSFTGSILSENSTNNAGFIGVALASCSINMTKCLFDPSSLPTNMTGCATFARYDQTATTDFNKCYYTKSYAQSEASGQSQGTSASAMTPTELMTALDDSQWTVVGEKVEPIPTIAYSQYIWDSRARLQLRVNMHGEKGVTHNVYDLSGNEEALQKHQFTQELTRKCVDYSFDLIVRRGSSPLKIWETEADSLVVPVQLLDESYRFQNSDTIKTITPQTKQSSVELTWETTGGEHDYYQVLRKDKINMEAKWDTIATNILGQYYEDKSVLVQHTYRYRVESVFQCEGTHISGIETEGYCETTGMINGYVRLADGTALAGEKMVCEPDDSTIIGKQTFTTYTDESGYFEFKGLPYQINEEGVSNGKYKVHVEAKGDRGTYTGPSGPGAGYVTFGQNSNWSSNFNFYLDTYYVFSGNVYYRDTSMPVSGVSFKLDGNEIHDATGRAIITDTQGGFSLSIPKGDHTVQAVKEGHYFAENGFLVNHNAARPEDRYLVNFSNNITSVFWDSTTVVLRGRVVGGDIQGSKPLGQSLSTNNLGDSLKIVMQLEGDNASYLIRKQDDETVKSVNYDVNFGYDNQDTTRVNVTRHTLTIRPDSKTGEYQLELHPAKYKVIEVSAQGYATLFQQGKVGETIDLTFNMKGDTCEYNRIYHAVPSLEVKQLNGGSEDYFGFKKYTATIT